MVNVGRDPPPTVSAATSGQTNAGWVTLFDGKNLDKFNQVGNADWKIEDGLVWLQKDEAL